MKRRPSRVIEIFSLSAIDLFAAGMSAFALLTIVLMPYYQKEIRERTPENALDELLRAAEMSLEETEELHKALDAKRSAAQANVSNIRSEADLLLAELRGAEATLKEKRAEATPVIEPPEPIDRQPGPADTSSRAPFRFLGMKTTANDIVIALDMNRCLGGHEASIQRAVERIVNSLQDNHAVRVIGFQQTDAGARVRAWPNAGLRQINAGAGPEAIRFASQLTRDFGGSSSMLDAFERMLDGPGEAIFLVSDGLPNPQANRGLRPGRLASEITRRNGGRKEIHTVVVGNYFDYDGTVEFMESLASGNGGQFMALASFDQGVCD